MLSNWIGLPAVKTNSRIALTGLVFVAQLLCISVSASAVGPCELAERQAREVFDDPRHKPSSRSAHDAITADLFNGRIIEFEPFTKDDNKQALFRVKIEAKDPYTGQLRYREAMFKPRVWGDGDGWARAPMEYVGYNVNRLLKMDYVPPVAYRKGLDLKWGEAQFTEGAFIHFSPEYVALAKLKGEAFPVIDEGVISDSRVLNVILQNKDAHNKNLGLGRHWVDGKQRPVFLDFGASLRAGTNVSVTDFPVFGNSKRVTRIRQSTLEALRTMNFESFRKLVEAGLINEGEAWQMDKIRYGVLSHFEALIKKAQDEGRPASDVVIPW